MPVYFDMSDFRFVLDQGKNKEKLRLIQAMLFLNRYYQNNVGHDEK